MLLSRKGEAMVLQDARSEAREARRTPMSSASKPQAWKDTDREAMEVSTSGKFSCQQYSWRKRAGSAAAVALAGRRSAEHAPERARSPRPGSMASTREGKPSKESGNKRWRSATRAAQPITPAQKGGRDALDVDYQLLRAFSRTARRLTGWRAGEGLMATCTSRTFGEPELCL